MDATLDILDVESKSITSKYEILVNCGAQLLPTRNAYCGESSALSFLRQLAC